MQVLAERLYTAPTRIYVEGKDTRKQFRRLTRDSSGKFWALGDNQVLFSMNGTDWNDLSANLKVDGTFTVDAVVLCGGTICLFARNRQGLYAYHQDQDSKRWRPVSEIHADGSCLASAPAPASLTLLARIRERTVAYRSTDQGRSWAQTTVGFDKVPVHLQLSDLGRGLCCFWNGFREEDPDAPDSSSLYSTVDSGVTWRFAASLDTMVLDATAIDNERILLGGSAGFLGMFDSDGRGKGAERYRDDVVAVDFLSGLAIAITESKQPPVRHSLVISENTKDWTKVPFRLRGRVAGVRLISEREFVLCTMREIYLCSLSSRRV